MGEVRRVCIWEVVCSIDRRQLLREFIMRSVFSFNHKPYHHGTNSKNSYPPLSKGGLGRRGASGKLEILSSELIELSSDSFYPPAVNSQIRLSSTRSRSHVDDFCCIDRKSTRLNSSH